MNLFFTQLAFTLFLSQLVNAQKKEEVNFSDPIQVDSSEYFIIPQLIDNAKEARRHLPPARTVVDLHIEKLTDDWEKMSNAEILEIQLKEFDKWYDLAVAHHQSQLIVIHGVGSGKLRDEIHDLLRLKRDVKSFVNQYHPSFGYGATEIYFQY